MANKGILEVVDILNDYSRDIQKGIEEDGNQVAKNAVSELKNTSPKRTGDYRKGWKKKKEEGFQSFTYIIHNATNYQLTHLLEKPHLKRNGGLTTPKVHIAPVEQESIREYEKMVENTIKNGG